MVKCCVYDYNNPRSDRYRRVVLQLRLDIGLLLEDDCTSCDRVTLKVLIKSNRLKLGHKCLLLDFFFVNFGTVFVDKILNDEI